MKRFTCILDNTILAAALSSHTMLTESQDRGQEAYQTAEEGYGKTGQEIYGRGSYVIGVGMPAGEYVVFTENTSENHAFSSCTLTSHKSDRDERKIDMLRFQHHGLIILYNDQYLILSRRYAAPVDQTDISAGTTGIYKAGRGMEPGTYRLTPPTSNGTRYALYNDIQYCYDYMDDYQAFSESVTMTLEEGQYIGLMDVSSVEKIDQKVFKIVGISADIGKWKRYYN